MIIKNWWFKNFKSFGNIPVNIDLGNGKLILLKGKNGNGKSALLSALDMAVFGECLNKKGKRLSKKLLINRRNANNLEVGCEFNNNGKEYKIIRTMTNSSSAIKTKLFIDNIPYDKAGKKDNKIIEEIGFDFKTFKSFISMNVNNFKNFISLTPEEKRLLLDKLFSLDRINELNKVLKELYKVNNLECIQLKNKIDVYSDEINNLSNTIKKVVESKKTNDESRKLEINNTLKLFKEKYDKLLIDKQELEDSIDLFRSGINKLSNKQLNINRDINDYNKKIKLFENGKCPTCESDLSCKLDVLEDYKTLKNKSEKIYNNLNNKIKDANIELKKYTSDFDDTSSNISELLQESNKLKTELKILNKNNNNNSIIEFEKTIKTLNSKKEDVELAYIESNDLKTVYNTLLPVWSENGIKQDIIDSIVDPINQYIEEDLIKLNTSFKVILDNNFDAHIFEYNEEVNVDTLSTGEAKKINLIIMLAYIKMLRMKRDINILILDEVFSSIDVDGIEDILKLFKTFAHQRNINIFLVHHSELKEFYFDQIITVDKNIYSDITMM